MKPLLRRLAPHAWVPIYLLGLSVLACKQCDRRAHPEKPPSVGRPVTDAQAEEFERTGHIKAFEKVP